MAKHPNDGDRSRRLPALTSRRVLAALGRAGFLVHHASGSHYVLKHSAHPTRRVTLPFHRGDLKRGTLESILKQTELSHEEFLKLL